MYTHFLKANKLVNERLRGAGLGHFEGIITLRVVTDWVHRFHLLRPIWDGVGTGE